MTLVPLALGIICLKQADEWRMKIVTSISQWISDHSLSLIFFENEREQERRDGIGFDNDFGEVSAEKFSHRGLLLLFLSSSLLSSPSTQPAIHHHCAHNVPGRTAIGAPGLYIKLYLHRWTTFSLPQKKAFIRGIRCRSSTPQRQIQERQPLRVSGAVNLKGGV
jgi:hypothetical protein